MAASTWSFYNMAKEYIGDATIDLDTDVFYMALFLSSSNASTATLITYASLTNEVASVNKYTQGGKSVAKTWATGASASERRWDSTAIIWTASGGSISGVKYAVIYASGGQLLVWSKLSTAAFSITDTNTLTVTPSANGYFELN